MSAEARFAFGAFHFDGRTGQLWRDGAEVKLTPRAAAVLHMLALRAPEVVTKQELFARVWGGVAGFARMALRDSSCGAGPCGQEESQCAPEAD